MNRDQFVNSYGQPMDWLMTTAKRNPEAFLVMAAGAALLMRGRGSSPNQAPDYRQMRNWQGSGGQSEASVSGTHMRQSARGSASTVSDTMAVRSQASRMADQATNFASQAHSAVQSGAGTVMREQPLAVALLGVAAGAVVAALLPSTKVEERTLGPAREALTEAAREMGENVVQSAKEAGKHLKQSAVERGLTPDGMKEMAREAADAFKSRMSGPAEQQSGNASSSGSTPPSSPGNGRPT